VRQLAIPTVDKVNIVGRLLEASSISTGEDALLDISTRSKKNSEDVNYWLKLTDLSVGMLIERAVGKHGTNGFNVNTKPIEIHEVPEADKINNKSKNIDCEKGNPKGLANTLFSKKAREIHRGTTQLSVINDTNLGHYYPIVVEYGKDNPISIKVLVLDSLGSDEGVHDNFEVISDLEGAFNNPNDDVRLVASTRQKDGFTCGSFTSRDLAKLLKMGKDNVFTLFEAGEKDAARISVVEKLPPQFIASSQYLAEVKGNTETYRRQKDGVETETSVDERLLENKEGRQNTMMTRRMLKYIQAILEIADEQPNRKASGKKLGASTLTDTPVATGNLKQTRAMLSYISNYFRGR